MNDSVTCKMNAFELGEQFDVVIVGAGVGGLTCGAILAKNGMKVLLIERNEKPGGFVTDYERKGFLFQVPHILTGCGENGELKRVFDYLGLKIDFVKVEPAHRYIYPEHEIEFYNLEQFRDDLKKEFLPETQGLKRLFEEIESIRKGLDKRILRKPIGASAALRFAVYPFLHMKAFFTLFKYEVLERFVSKHIDDEILATILCAAWPMLGTPPWELSSLAFIQMLDSLNQGAFFPVGGFGKLTSEFARVFEEDGGMVLFGHEVIGINTRDGEVFEVEMQPRAKVRARTVVSDSDTKRTFLKLASRENFTRSFLDRIDEIPLSLSGFVVHLGLGKRIEEKYTGGITFVQPSYDEREMYDEVRKLTEYPDHSKIKWYMTVPSLEEPSLAPQGKSYLKVVVPGAPYKFMRRWGVEEGGKRGERYQAIKEEYARRVIEAVGLSFPGMVSDVEAFDASTPISFERYGMALDGCWQDSAQTPASTFIRRHGPMTPLKGLYLTGSKSSLGGGIHGSIMNGVLTADAVLRGKLENLLTT